MHDAVVDQIAGASACGVRHVRHVDGSAFRYWWIAYTVDKRKLDDYGRGDSSIAIHNHTVI